MCGRYALGLTDRDLVDYYDIPVTRLDQWVPRWNIAPTSIVPIVLAGESGMVLVPARWSLTPHWSDTLNTPYPTFNARSETAGTKPTFRTALKHHRALIPASGYFEWKTHGTTKTPHFIYPHNDDLLSLAGLHSTWNGGDTPIVTVTILTRPAPEHLAHIHPRSPVAIPRQAWSRWLDADETGNQALVDQMVDISDDVFAHCVAHAVSPLRGDHPGLINPVGN